MFFDWFETIELECDAPQYSIVQACRALGFRSPEDVRWCQVPSALAGPKPPHRWFSWGFLKSLLGRREPRPASCRCGQPLPHLDSYTFFLDSGAKQLLLLGQCSRCRTIFWREQ